MAIIINPGSDISAEDGAKGWTNSHDQAAIYAREWFLEPMLEEGFTDIEMEDTGEDDDNGRWLFKFKHTVTGKVIELYQHGIDDLDAYQAQCIFTPKVYWDGGSSSNPELNDFAADGFKPVMTYRKDKNE